MPGTPKPLERDGTAENPVRTPANITNTYGMSAGWGRDCNRMTPRHMSDFFGSDSRLEI
ncbi:hypothetical protein ACWEQC_13475 [Streptomyces shenzhenensis]